MSDGVGILLGFAITCLFGGGLILVASDGKESLGVMAVIASIILGALLFEKS